MLLLTACGSGGEPVGNHGYGFEYNVQGEIGVKLRYAPTLSASDPMANPVFIENVYSQVLECSGVSAPAPFVIIVQAGSLSRDTWAGEYFASPPLILLATTSPEVVRHEMIHHVLTESTGNTDPQHQSHLFLARAAGGCA